LGYLGQEETLEKSHLAIETMAKLLAGTLSHEEMLSEVVSHLLHVCPSCRHEYEEILRLKDELGHWDERVVVLEGRQVPELMARLKDNSFDEQIALVREDETFHTWAFCQVLLGESLEIGFQDPQRAINLAELAVIVSQQLGDAYDPYWVLDLRAKAYAYLGNAQRILGELRSAETAFREAESLLARSMTGNPLIEAEVLHLKASLFCAQRRPEEGLALVDRALAIYRESGDTNGAGTVLLKKAKIVEEAGDLEDAIGLLKQLVTETGANQEVRLLLYARYNLMLCLTAAGRYLEAKDLLPQIKDSFTREARPLDLLRLRWTEGKIALGLGRTEKAEEAFRAVQQEFLNRSMGYDAALVSLDLAVLLSQERRTSELKQLAAELMRVFESRDVHREAVAALIMFQKACEEERLTAQLAGRIATLLKEAKRPR
jgi:tetratricopeptide (TPR) repeat protein